MSQLARENPDDWQELEHQMKEHGRVPRDTATAQRAVRTAVLAYAANEDADFEATVKQLVGLGLDEGMARHLLLMWDGLA